MSGAIRAAVIGLGVGQAHLKAWEDEGAEIGFVAALNYGSGNLSECNAASIATYDDDHGPRAIDLLKRGMSVMVEKPLCLEWGQLEQIANLTEGRKNAVTCNFPLRFHSDFVLLKENIVADPSIYHIEADYEWGRFGKLGGWRGDMPGGYSVMHGAGSHMVNLAAWLVGSRIDWVFALGKGAMATVVGIFENGVTFRSNINCAFEGQHRHRVVAWRKSGPTKVSNTLSADKGSAVRDFARSLKNDTEPEITRQEVLDTSCVLFAAENSMRSRLAEKVAYL